MKSRCIRLSPPANEECRGKVDQERHKQDLGDKGGVIGNYAEAENTRTHREYLGRAGVAEYSNFLLRL